MQHKPTQKARGMHPQESRLTCVFVCLACAQIFPHSPVLPVLLDTLRQTDRAWDTCLDNLMYAMVGHGHADGALSCVCKGLTAMGSPYTTPGNPVRLPDEAGASLQGSTSVGGVLR